MTLDTQAYFEEWSRKPGETVRMAISSAHNSVHATFEQLKSGPGAKGDRQVVTHALPQILDRTVQTTLQRTAVGSFAAIPLDLQLDTSAFAIRTTIWPTLPEKDATQTIWSLGSLSLTIRGGRIEVRSANEVISAHCAVSQRTWYAVVVNVIEQDVTLYLSQLSGYTPVEFTSTVTGLLPKRLGAPDTLYLGAAGRGEYGSALNPFNGKIGNTSIYSTTLPAPEETAWSDKPAAEDTYAVWDLALRIDTSEIVDVGGRELHGRIVNGAERGVTSHTWDGTVHSFADAPSQYAAVHFHEDEMVDAGWDYTLEFDLPHDLPSGVYAVKLFGGEHVDRFPLFVQPAASARADVLFVVPTNTYLAYANDRLAGLDTDGIMAHEKVVPDEEQEIQNRSEFGLSCYDTHSDGSAVRYSSRRRPLVNVRPGFPSWLTGSYRHFAADLYFIEWLANLGVSFHVVTDEEVHNEGEELLERHSVVLTGSHPEYWTGQALTAVQSYLRDGGRLMYLGGNGFYWVTSHDKERPWVIELRRDNAGLRAWDAPPGEQFHVSTGERGGLWKYRGRGPHSTVGIGFTTEGFSKAQPYRRTDASRTGIGARIFEGIDTDLIGENGLVLGGAAGDECDRYDPVLGSPGHALVLASATGFGPEYLPVNEDTLIPTPNQNGQTRPDLVRADMVYFETGNGGAVFSVGSIAWAGALAWNEFDNPTARVTENVLRLFTEPK